MKAIVVEDAELHVADVPAPELVPGAVRIRVAAAGVNRADLMQRRGLYPPPPGASDVLGLECAGEVVEVGDGVAGWTPGDRAMALLAGGATRRRWSSMRAARCACPRPSRSPRPPSSPRST